MKGMKGMERREKGEEIPSQQSRSCQTLYRRKTRRRMMSKLERSCTTKHAGGVPVGTYSEGNSSLLYVASKQVLPAPPQQNKEMNKIK
jgi:hypothetical protein